MLPALVGGPEPVNMKPECLCMGCMIEKGQAEYCSQCGWKEGTLPESVLQLPSRTTLVGRYLLGRVLGQGGFGITYLAWDLLEEKKLAVKEYFPTALSTRKQDHVTVSAISGANVNDFDYGLRKFEREARVLQRVRDRPGVVSLLNFFEANGTAYIVMSFVEGRNFKEFLDESGGSISFLDALQILKPVMKALQEVHSVGLLHRDISPANIYVGQNGEVTILDFGTARHLFGEQSQSLQLVVKPGYAPEEQYRSKGEQGAWTDVYALAATFYRAVTGRVPSDALERLAEDRLQKPSELGVQMPRKSEEALLKGLAVLKKNRFATVAEFESAIVPAGRFDGAIIPEQKSPADKGLAKPFSGPAKQVEKKIRRVSKPFFLVSVGVLVLVFTFSNSLSLLLQTLSLLGLCSLIGVFIHRVWGAVQDGHTTVTPGKAVGFLYIPAYNIYWAFRVFWGFSKEYNKFIDRYSLGLLQLPEHLFFVSTLLLVLTGWISWLLFLELRGVAFICVAAGTLVGGGLLLWMFSRICDAVNALPPNLHQDSPHFAAPRALSIYCLSGEFSGQHISPVPHQGIIIGRDPNRVNLVLSSHEVSAQHARVWPDSDGRGLWLADLNSTNGTYYREGSFQNSNPRWVRLSQSKLLTAGTRFRVAQEAEFEVRQA
jgi:serine/threonine protein kinase